MLSRLEGIIPALESAHAIAYLKKLTPKARKAKIIVCLSGRGDKDLGIVKTREYTGERLWNLNPHFGVGGHFQVPSEVVKSTERLEIRVSVTVIDQYERKHQLLPLAWVYMRDRNSWYLEPCGNDT
jgi:hypothetical protein